MRGLCVLVVATLLLAGCASDDKEGPAGPEDPIADSGRPVGQQKDAARSSAEEAIEYEREHYNVSVHDRVFLFMERLPDTPVLTVYGSYNLITVEQEGEFVSGRGELVCDAPTDTVFEWRVEVWRGGTFGALSEAHTGPSPLVVTFGRLHEGDEIDINAWGPQGGGAHVDATCDFEMSTQWDVPVS